MEYAQTRIFPSILDEKNSQDLEMQTDHLIRVRRPDLLLASVISFSLPFLT